MNSSPEFAPAGPRLHRSRAFALVITLIILSALVIVAVGYLAGMAGERTTAAAYGSQARAEQAAQTGVDSAVAILRESFRDFPDSATVWDTTQSANSDGTFNEGTSLYVRAVPQASGTATVPNPSPSSSTDASDASGNGPNNPSRRTFVLPLVSGVPGGNGQLVANKATILPAFNTSVTDPTQQTYTDLNVRRFAGDLQGVIGSPPNWSTTAGVTGPKPARAPWVTVKDSSGNVTARYAFWVEDESFRANVNAIGNVSQTYTTPRVDNTAQPTASPSASPSIQRNLQPADMSLPGLLVSLNDAVMSANLDSKSVLGARAAYPASFFPDPWGFEHAADATIYNSSPPGTAVLDALRYEASTQSGSLNLTRHGTQRVNLDALVPGSATFPGYAPPATSTVQTQINQLFQTISFHLPNFGQRFYRLATDTSPTTLNNATQVSSSDATIYLYKIATNIHDYIDPSTQPTFVLQGGTVAPQAPITASLSDDGSPNTYWAQGKKNSPYIQEVAARYRPIVATSACPNTSFNYPRNHYDLCIDYYIEFWNMSDRDVYAVQQSDPTLPHLNGAHLIIRDQQPWTIYPGGGSGFYTDQYTPSSPNNFLPPGGVPSQSPAPPVDDVVEIDLTAQVSAFNYVSNNYVQVALNGSNNFATPDGRTLKPLGVVFPAGSVSVITTDPSCFIPSGSSYPAGNPNIQQVPGKTAYQPIGLSGSPAPPTALTQVNYTTTFLCQNLVQGTRHMAGTIQSPVTGIVSAGGLQLDFTNDYKHFQTEISLVNPYGYLDVARCALAQYSNNSVYTNTYTQIPSQGGYNDFSYVSSLVGNAVDKAMPSTDASAPASLVSELGDPRTNNEQLSITAQFSLSTGGNGDQSRYFANRATLGYINNVTVRPDGVVAGSYSSSAPASSWPDYFTTVAQGSFASPGLVNAPAVVAGAPLTSIGQLGDIFDPARLPGADNTAKYSRGGGRTLKIGQHDDRYDPTPTSSDGISNSNGWAAWRLADIFSADPIPPAQLTTQAEPIELPGRININGVARDNGAALSSALTSLIFQPTTTTDPLVHGDGHTANSGYKALAGQTFSLSGTAGLPELVKAMKARLNPTAASTEPSPFFERGELGEVADGGVYLFGNSAFIPPPPATGNANTLLMSNSPVDMNNTFDRGREELFRRLSELICTRGDTFTVYAAGQSLVQAPGQTGNATPTFKITGTQRRRVTFRLVPMTAANTPFHPAYDSDGTPITLDLTTPNKISTRFAKPDHYDIQILESNVY